MAYNNPNIPKHPASAIIANAYATHQHELRSYLGRFCRAGQIEDVLQDALERALRAKSLPKDSQAIRGALFRHAHFAAVDLFRHESAYTARNVHEARLAQLPVLTPEDLVIDQEEKNMAVASLARLSERKKSHMTPRIYAEARPAEIAETTGTSENTVRASQSDAIKMMRADMARHGYGTELAALG